MVMRVTQFPLMYLGMKAKTSFFKIKGLIITGVGVGMSKHFESLPLFSNRNLVKNTSVLDDYSICCTSCSLAG